MKPDKYKLMEYKKRFKEKIKSNREPIYGEFFCSECGCSMNKNEFMDGKGICVWCEIDKDRIERE